MQTKVADTSYMPYRAAKGWGEYKIQGHLHSAMGYRKHCGCAHFRARATAASTIPTRKCLPTIHAYFQTRQN
jgi:hypothetical protein